MANIFYKGDLARMVKGENEVLMLSVAATGGRLVFIRSRRRKYCVLA